MAPYREVVVIDGRILPTPIDKLLGPLLSPCELLCDLLLRLAETLQIHEHLAKAVRIPVMRPRLTRVRDDAVTRRCHLVPSRLPTPAFEGDPRAAGARGARSLDISLRRSLCICCFLLHELRLRKLEDNLALQHTNLVTHAVELLRCQPEMLGEAAPD